MWLCVRWPIKRVSGEKRVSQVGKVVVKVKVMAVAVVMWVYGGMPLGASIAIRTPCLVHAAMQGISRKLGQVM